MKNKGKVTQIISAVVDVEFENGDLPAIYNALEVINEGKKLILEVNHHNEPPEAHFLERSWYYIFD